MKSILAPTPSPRPRLHIHLRSSCHGLYTKLLASPNLPTPGSLRGGAEAAATFSVAELLAQYKSETHWRQAGREGADKPGLGPIKARARPCCLPPQHKVSGLPPDCLFVSELRQAEKAADKDHGGGGGGRTGRPWLSPVLPSLELMECRRSKLPRFPTPTPKFQTDVQSDSSSPWLRETKEIKNGTLETLLAGEP